MFINLKEASTCHGKNKKLLLNNMSSRSFDPFETGSQQELEKRKKSFVRLSLRLQSILLREAIQVLAFRDLELPYFSKMKVEQQEALLKSFEAQIEVMEMMPNQGFSFLRSNKVLVLSFVAKMGLSTAPDLLDHLKDTDFVAVYNHLQQMIFLTPNHLIWMSYSLEGLHCRPWYELFKRTENVEKILMSRAQAFALGQRLVTQVNLDIPPHLVTEIDGAQPRSVTCHSKFYSPIFKEGIPAGFISANQDTIGAKIQNR